ncbi:hypothetical protein AVEN_241444-1 [Araneus ventricosus]|uniref:Uncharacterized protein n=1 Tax=Araneus ventricosus TaxID=182803 RepID=A0A4Y2FZS6_ARAVE|nr:hypothetical protein AVEN_241444-1 [Araneus ventricosus]
MVSMTRVGPFSKVAERFASQQEARFSVRFPQAFITSLFQAFQKVFKSPTSANKIEPSLPLSEAILQQKDPTPFLQSRTPTERKNFEFLQARYRTLVHRVGRQTQ